MIASGPPSNRLLQMLDAADFDLLRPHLITIELVRETVLGEAGAALRQVSTFRTMEPFHHLSVFPEDRSRGDARPRQRRWRYDAGCGGSCE